AYGAFIKIGNGISGLCHISQITGTKRLRHPKEVLAVGDKVNVKVIDIKDGKISLSIKALTAPPKKERAPKKEKKEEADIVDAYTDSMEEETEE
ncbi:MAG: S1 RNA-binding domain-containing protein, partial [Eubacteriales bacterium]|nr:S1 RNA-binding domain-containing protein [Eubacteriales bacterium]